VETDGADRELNCLLKEIMPAATRKEGSFIEEIAKKVTA